MAIDRTPRVPSLGRSVSRAGIRVSALERRAINFVGDPVYFGRHTIDDVGVTDEWLLEDAGDIPDSSGGGPPSLEFYKGVTALAPFSDAQAAVAYPNSYTGIRFTTLSPAFATGWTNGDPILEPCCFWVTASGHIHFSGWPAGGDPGTQICDPLPSQFRPFQKTYLHMPTDAAGVSANAVFDIDGSLTFIG